MTWRLRVEVEHPVDGLADELDIVADHDEAARVVLQELAQPDDGVGVEVVRRLVEDHRVGVGEQDAGELDAAALAAGEGLQLLVEDAVGQVEVARDRGGLGLGRVPAEHQEPVLEVAVLLHGRFADRGIRRCHAHACASCMPRTSCRGRGRRGCGCGRGPPGRRSAGPAAGSRSRRTRSIVPAVGSSSPARVLVSVVLPAPLRPTRPILSPSARGR